MAEENISREFSLKYINETGNYFNESTVLSNCFKCRKKKVIFYFKDKMNEIVNKFSLEGINSFLKCI